MGTPARLQAETAEAPSATGAIVSPNGVSTSAQSPANSAAQAYETTATTTLVLPSFLDEHLEDYASKVGMNKADLIKMVLNDYLNQQTMHTEGPPDLDRRVASSASPAN